MGCSRDDLERWLREMLGPAVPAFRDDRLALHAQGVPVTLRVADAPPRRLGLVTFRALDVSFDYAPDDGAAVRAFIARFDRHTQRGGG